jgi:threonyl-tRNA synthetase
LEHTAGNFPLWLAPQQVSILCVSEKHEKYAQKVLNILENNEIRALLDNRNETIGKKIRESELNKIPFMLIVGEQEATQGNISVRKHKEGDVGTLSVENLIEMVQQEISESISTFEV